MPAPVLERDRARVSWGAKVPEAGNARARARVRRCRGVPPECAHARESAGE